ncbi:U4/U6 small nuclear ribonucleoprotein Prp3 [Halotydeus destructor]|nr:U4/U6 small nuclear ribonucleoprotein Prp3 [Halotydeus destructor]
MPAEGRRRWDKAPVTEETKVAAPANSMLSGDQIKKMMAEAQRQIEDKKRQLAHSTPLATPPLAPVTPVIVDSKTRIAQLQAQIQARLASRPTIDKVMVDESKANKPAPLILNAEGRTVDVTGKEKREQFTKISNEKQSEDKTDSAFFDARVDAKTAVRAKRSFKFHEKGTFESLAHRLRTKAQLEKLNKEIAEKAKKTGISSAARLALLSSIQPKKREVDDEVPDVEWWDSFIMKDEKYVNCTANKSKPEEKYDGITHLIEHPIQMKPPAEPSKPIPLPVFLTAAEKKKLRRQNRREAWKEKQENIRLGLEAPPEAKVKLTNMMRVLGSQAVQDPTKMEAHVREQMAKRQKAHEDANEARKLTVDQKRQKKVKKVKEDTSLGVHVAVYRLLSLHNPAKKFKVEVNAKQLLMTGVIILYKNINVVVVEGGPKQQRKFKNLMLKRIKWSEDPATKESKDEQAEKSENKCFLVWEGLAKSRSFGEIKFKVSPNESFARELFRNHGVEQYFDLAYSMTFLEASDL